MKHDMSCLAKCPYYRHENKQMIYCDGVQDGTVTHLAFANATDALKYKWKFCRKDYGKCRICRMLNDSEAQR